MIGWKSSCQSTHMMWSIWLHACTSTVTHFEIHIDLVYIYMKKIYIHIMILIKCSSWKSDSMDEMYLSAYWLRRLSFFSYTLNIVYFQATNKWIIFQQTDLFTTNLLSSCIFVHICKWTVLYLKHRLHEDIWTRNDLDVASERSQF